MDLGNKDNLEIIKKYCLVEGGCPKLRKCKSYQEKVQVCSQCIDKIYKYDMVEILRELYGNQGTTPTKPVPPKTGKGTEKNITQIKKILLLHKDGKSINKIANLLHFSHRTVKNVVNMSFENESSNEKVKRAREELEKDGLL